MSKFLNIATHNTPELTLRYKRNQNVPTNGKLACNDSKHQLPASLELRMEEKYYIGSLIEMLMNSNIRQFHFHFY